MKGLIRNIIYWAFELGPDECFVLDGPESEVMDITPEGIQEVEEARGATLFCRARPGVPAGDPEHVHHTPDTEGERQRATALGWMVDTKCLLPSTPFTVYPGEGGNVPSSVTQPPDGGL